MTILYLLLICECTCSKCTSLRRIMPSIVRVLYGQRNNCERTRNNNVWQLGGILTGIMRLGDCQSLICIMLCACTSTLICIVLILSNQPASIVVSNARLGGIDLD